MPSDAGGPAARGWSGWGILVCWGVNHGRLRRCVRLKAAHAPAGRPLAACSRLCRSNLRRTNSQVTEPPSWSSARPVAESSDVSESAVCQTGEAGGEVYEITGRETVSKSSPRAPRSAALSQSSWDQASPLDAGRQFLT